MNYLKEILRVLSIVLLFLSLPQFLEAQAYDDAKGYYVNLNNDTIHGFFKTADRHKLCESFSFKENDSKQEYQTLLSNDCHSCFFGLGESYISFIDETTNDTIFVQELNRGPLNLYAFYLANKTVYYLLKEGDPQIYRLEKNNKIIEKDGKEFEWIDKKYQGILALITQDCPKVNGLTKNVSWENKSFVKFVDAYNSCIDPNTNYKSNYRSTKFKLGVDLGTILWAKPTFFQNQFKSNSFKNELGIELAVYLKFQALKMLSIDLGLGYSYVDIHIEKTSQNNYHIEDVHYIFHHLDIPLALQYNMTNTRLSPFVYAHCTYSFILSHKAVIESNSDQLTGTQELLLNNQKWAWGGGIGASLDQKYQIKLDYTRTQYLRGVTQVLQNNYVSLRLSYLF